MTTISYTTLGPQDITDHHAAIVAVYREVFTEPPYADTDEQIAACDQLQGMSTPELHVRLYRPADHATVIRLNAYGLAAAGVPVSEDVYAGDLDDIAATYLTGRAVMLVGEVEGTVVAMGALREADAQACEVLRMRVDPRHQRLGYGRTMLHALEKEARSLGYEHATLLTGPSQHPAIDLYYSAGYTHVADEVHGTVAGIRLAKDLI
jgi:ribosomal protein S18 acetylase RimI-like enzyme